MGYRLSKIYTRTGDKGTTGLGNGQRVDKDSDRIEAIGTIDELNSLVGILIAQGVPEDIETILTEVQHRLFDLGGELSIPSLEVTTSQAVLELEHQLDRLNEDLPPLKEFILPGGSLAATHCHHARTVCRRAERRVLHLARQEGEPVGENTLKYLNRLSDLLFVMARVLARVNGGSEVFWSKQR
ncbi:MAG: cob(I)yrinic acid a,c-diamide adenosyltransferase [Gammaproteobacteria bacterium]|nr:cob(I)yrinic acid a,c-diamide adenosyltransferase [Gammaproteobacteria bacterium]